MSLDQRVSGTETAAPRPDVPSPAAPEDQPRLPLADWRRILLEVGTATAREPEDVLGRVVDASVPFLADACIVDLVAGDRLDRRALVAHADPLRATELDQVEAKWGALPNVAFAALQCLQNGRPVLVGPMGPDYFQAAAVDPDHFVALVRLAFRSWAVVPLVTDDGAPPRGVLRLATMGTGRPLEADDLARAAELGRVGGQALADACAFHALRGRVTALQREVERVATGLDSLRSGLAATRVTEAAAAAALGTSVERLRAALRAYDALPRGSARGSSLRAQQP